MQASEHEGNSGVICSSVARLCCLEEAEEGSLLPGLSSAPLCCSSRAEGPAHSCVVIFLVLCVCTLVNFVTQPALQKEELIKENKQDR